VEQRLERPLIISATLTPFPLGHFTLSQFLLGPSSREQTLLAGACSQARFLFAIRAKSDEWRDL